MYGIENRVYESLMRYFQSNKQIEKVILFGSRAKATQNKNSDIDLCLTYSGNNRGTVIFEIEDRVGIYSVDIVFENAIGEALYKQINRDGKVIYSIEENTKVKGIIKE